MATIRAAVVLLLLSRAALCLGLDNGLGRTPQMGWNSWNHFRCDITATVLEETADAFISTGLSKLGYEYVNVDDCWAKSRDAQGNVQPDPETFPDMASLADYIHSKGLKFGLYSAAGNKTCQGRPGSLGYEIRDANSYAKWGVDYLKYDNCHNPGLPPMVRYPPMQKALNQTGRPIFYSVHAVPNPITWDSLMCNSWRTTSDIKDYWEKMIYNAETNDQWWTYSGPGGWNDPDMLEVGNGGMTVTEYETHFSLWCLMKAPLLIGCDVRNMSSDTLRILTNSEVIAVNQDPLGEQGHKVKSVGKEGLEQEVWAGPLSDGAFAVLLLNKDTEVAQVTADWSDFGLDPSVEAKVRDLWQHKDLGTMKGSVSVSVPSHGVAMYRITPI